MSWLIGFNVRREKFFNREMSSVPVSSVRKLLYISAGQATEILGIGYMFGSTFYTSWNVRCTVIRPGRILSKYISN